MKLTLAFIAKHGTPVLEIDDSGEVASVELISLLDVLGTRTETGFRFQPCQQATPDLKSRVQALALQLQKTAPQLGGLAKFFLKFDDNEFFILLNRRTQSTEEYIALAAYLEVLNGGKVDGDAQATEEIFGKHLRLYNTIAYDNTKPIRIGAKSPADKRCRFCGGTALTGATFAKKAHAISEALGNKLLVLADECDDCNEYFGKNVETSLINFLNVQRVFLRIPGKDNKIPTIHYSNGTISHDGERMLVTSSGVSETPTGFRVDLGKGPSFVPEDCYRSLVKFALSTVEDAHLAALSRTIQWVRYAERPEGQGLPLLYWGLVPFDRTSSPSIVLQVRKKSHTSLPHVVAEFRIGPFVFVYMLPFSEQDRDLSADWFHTVEFKDTFRHYASVNWSTVNFDNRKSQGPPTVLSMNQRVRSGEEPQDEGKPNER